jgi:hypothetical protein
VINIEMIFSKQWRVGVTQCTEGRLWRRCRFNASVLAQEGRQWDKVLSEDEAEAVSSSCLHGKEA